MSCFRGVIEVNISFAPPLIVLIPGGSVTAKIHYICHPFALGKTLRVLYKKCGQEGKNATFILTEAEMKDETFLEIMNSFLMTGEVPNLFPKV